MKFLFAIAALVAAFSTQPAQAAPSSSNVSQWIFASGAANIGRQFIDSRTDSSLNCSIFPLTSCPTPPSCYRYARMGWNPSNQVCCQENYICRDGEPAADLIAASEAAEKEAQAQDSKLEEVFSTEGRTNTYWGYITSTNRSPNAGRSNAPTARLDACIGHGETDMLGTGSTGWSNCYNKCDSSSNGYCNNTATNDGTTMTNAACKDRCDCTITGYGTCEGQ